MSARRSSSSSMRFAATGTSSRRTCAASAASAWQPHGYWFHDYVADLEALLDAFAPGEAVNLVGHSLGGNIAMHYAGVRPAARGACDFAGGFRHSRRGAGAQRRRRSRSGSMRCAIRRRSGRTESRRGGRPAAKTNPRLPRDKADFLARALGGSAARRSARLRSDPRHKLPFPSVYRMEEVYAIWRAITAPVLWIAAEESDIPRWLGDHPEGEGLRTSLPGSADGSRTSAARRLVTIRRRRPHAPPRSARRRGAGDRGFFARRERRLAIVAQSPRRACGAAVLLTLIWGGELGRA